MKKRFLTLILTFATMLMCIFGLSACNKVEFKVNFMVDGAVYATVNTNGEETIKMPDDPVKEDYIFDGWYWDENTWQEPFTANSLLNAPLSSNMSVYAKFTEESDVKGTDIRMDGYTFTDDESLGKVYYISLPNNKIVYALYEDVTVHNKSTWTLSTDISGNNTITSKTVELSVGNNVYYILVTDKASNVKQYIVVVRRRPIYTVSFDTNGGGYCETQSVEEGSLATAPETPTKTGYTFAEWDWDFNAPILMDTTISASWTANNYSIYYDANGGTVSKAEQSVEYNQNYTLSTPTRNGYTFNGWYKGNEKVNDGKWTFVENWYLTAQWTANSNAITYDLNGGKNHTNNPSSYKTGATVTLGEPTKTGYTFVGWTTNEITTPTQEMSILAEDYGAKTFTAHWTANDYTVTYNANGGTASKENDAATYDSGFTLATAERTGYTFVGWYNGKTKVVDGTWNIADNVTLVAEWTIDNYIITYDLGDGTATNKDSYTYETETFSLNEPTKMGYTFDGWTYNGQETPIKTVTIEKGSIGAKSYTAHWTANEYAITYNANGGTASKETDTATYDSEFILATAERKGYTFVGWYNGNTKVVNGDWKITNDVTLTAKWQIITYTIGYDLDGGTATNVKTYTVEDEITLNQPKKTGYTFTGWTGTDLTQFDKFVTIEKGSIGDRSYTANWTANEYTVTYNANGGVASKETDTATYDSEFTLASVERTGYTFDGWYSGTTKYVSGIWKTTEPISLKAKWTANTYKISYDANGGTISNAQQSVTYDSAYTLKEPTRTGYTFLYWAYNGEEFTSGTWNLVSSVTLVAEWRANEYTVTYNANGGECDMPSDTVTYDATYTVPTTTRVGYTFDGWYNGNTEYFGGTWRTANNVTLTAKWIAHTNIPYTVNHYLQNIEDDSYTFDSTQDFTGTSDDYVTPSVNTYTGFTSPTAQTVKVNPDGSRVVDYYYTRNYYTITLVSNGGNVIAEQRYKYQEILNIPTPERENYTFGGWFTNERLLSAFNNSEMSANNKTLYAWWSEENKPADFTYTGSTEITISGYVGASSTMWIPSYIGGKAVTIIPESAFENKIGLVKVVVPDSVTSIGVGAFKGCNAIEGITLPFLGGSMNTTASDAVFGYIFGVTTKTVSKGGNYSSYYDASTGENVYSPESLTVGSTNLVNYRAGTSTEMYQPEGTTWQYSCYSAYNSVYSAYYLRSYYYYIPSSIKNVIITKQTEIPVAAFNGCDFIETITLSVDVENIGDYAFQNCNATIQYA